MSAASVSELVAAWSATDRGVSEAEIDRRILGFTALVRAIAVHGRATPSALATETNRTPEQVSEFFRGMAAGGLQLDDDGNVIGAALSVRPTPHRLRTHMAGPDLYAWCALDTLFLPGLLDVKAEVESTCPVSGSDIHLTVTPDGVDRCDPKSAVLSVVDPRPLGGDRNIGPASPT